MASRALRYWFRRAIPSRQLYFIFGRLISIQLNLQIQGMWREYHHTADLPDEAVDPLRTGCLAAKRLTHRPEAAFRFRPPSHYRSNPP
ncbi:hypothetical protein SBA3_1750003 [Candidatus Sulfopaludibacter sp. SbA3]|nr:hypothetical protein SBA3_1750003 [Candidatus Sulfopaludibacter sp. SbA3]